MASCDHFGNQTCRANATYSLDNENHVHVLAASFSSQSLDVEAKKFIKVAASALGHQADEAMEVMATKFRAVGYRTSPSLCVLALSMSGLEEERSKVARPRCFGEFNSQCFVH